MTAEAPVSVPSRRRAHARHAGRIAFGAAVIVAAGFAWPERAQIPVAGATSRDWNARTFWSEPWGTSGVHKGIDIFAPEGRPVVSAVSGLRVYQGTLSIGGEVVAVLGPRWRIHYYAHLKGPQRKLPLWVGRGAVLGAVGTTGNAAGKPPHLHYTVLSLVPLPWRATSQTQGWKRMFFVDPGEVLATVDR